MNNQKSIVFVNQSSGYLMIDIIHAHLPHYQKVVLLTGFLNPRNKTLAERVEVRMLKPYDRTSTLKRFSSWLTFSRQVYAYLKKHPESDVYYVSNPPFTVFLAYLLRHRSSFLIYDVYPDVLVHYGVLSGRNPLVKLWKMVNRKVFSRTKKLYTIGDGMKQLLQQYCQPGKVEVVPVWSDNTFLKPLAKTDNPFAREHGLEEQFVVLYSGNIGRTHPVEILLSLADHLRDLPVKILIIGEGEKKKQLVTMKEKEGLDNVLILPYQPTDVLPYSMACADLGVVTLGEEASNLSVPSKTFNLMSVGAPILAIAGNDSELANLVQKYENGICTTPNKVDEISEFVRKLISDRAFHQGLSERSLEASLNYTPQNAESLMFS